MSLPRHLLVNQTQLSVRHHLTVGRELGNVVLYVVAMYTLHPHLAPDVNPLLIYSHKKCPELKVTYTFVYRYR